MFLLSRRARRPRLRHLLGLLVLLAACKSQVERPKLTEDEYRQQASKLLATPLKLFEQKDAEKINRMALGLLRARVINCRKVGTECEAYSKVMNRLVQKTGDGKFTEAEREEVRGLFKELRDALSQGHQKLKSDWQAYEKSIKK